MCALWSLKACYLWSFCYFHYKSQEFSCFTFTCKLQEFLSIWTSFTASSQVLSLMLMTCCYEISEANLNELPTIIFSHGTIVVLPPFMMLGCLNKVLVCHSTLVCSSNNVWNFANNVFAAFLSQWLENNFDVTVCFLIEKLKSL